jgi:hypothetical protein
MARWRVALVLIALWNAPLFGDTREVELEERSMNPSAKCGLCHTEIYTMWRRSMHSAAFTDPIFQVSYMQAYLHTGGEAEKTCLRCHAPLAIFAEGPEDLVKAREEGIACDFCHSVAAVNLENAEAPFEIRFDGKKRGPLADADSPVHGVAKSEVHQASEFCAGCHEYVTDDGMAILSTYSEWRLSPQAKEGKTCQHCHMPLTPGKTVRSGLGVDRDSINLHNISGMHSTEQVRSAATAKILKLERQKPDLALVEVEVVNSGSGHSIPTGLPTRRLILEVVLFSGGLEVRRFERFYQKTLLDSDGQIITDDYRAMLDARKILNATRLRPGERRVERFVGSVPETGRLHAEMKLRYSYEPMVLSRQRISIEIASESSR